MKNRGLARASIVSICVLATTFGCGSGGSPTKSTQDSADAAAVGDNEVDVFSWWVAPGEAEALQALFDTYQTDYPKAHVSHDDNISADTWQTVLGANIDNPPWDVFQMSASDIQKFSSDHKGAVTPLGDFYDEPSLKAAVIPEIRDAVTVDGQPLGIVTGVHRNGTLIYNKQIFDAQGIAAPETLADVLAACKKLKAAGITPVAATFQGWALRIMFDEILAGVLGAQGYADFLNSGSAPSDDKLKADITSAIDTFHQILTEYVDVGVSKDDKYGWAEAAATLHDGKAAMYFHGDWAKGYLTALGWTPGVDFSVLGPPGAADLFIYGADMFGLPKAAPHPESARHFLEVLASKEGQVAFNRRKGSTPMRTDVRDELDQPGKNALDNLMNARVLMKGHANASWDDAFGAYAKDGDKNALLQTYLTATP